MSIVTEKNKIKELIFSRYIEETFPSREKVLDFLASGKKLTFYIGIDPTGPDIHLGHTTNFIVLKRLIGLGHKVILLIGDFTAQTGDPTGKEATRRSLGEKEVKENMKSYIRQVQKILPKGSFEVKYNSNWLKKLNLQDFRKIIREVTVQQLLHREMFQRRFKEEKPISVEEFLYPVMQGYDSVAMEVDGEVGGRDQTFNMLIGRSLAKIFLQKEKIVITTKLLEDPQTGKKMMSKSEGQYISLNDQSEDLFGKVMAIPDNSILTFFSLLTEVPDSKIEEVKKRMESGENPKFLKEELGSELVKMYFGYQEAANVKNKFKMIFEKGQIPSDIPEVKINNEDKSIVNLLVENKIVNSRSEAKQLIQQKAIKINGETIGSWEENLDIENEATLQVGPRRFFKIKK